MHRCLQIAEVIRLICEQCTPNTLSATARTCRTWRDPALDVLWQSQTSLVPLIKCLPSRVMSHEIVEDRRILRLREPINPDDWSTVQKYNRRVKKLTLQSAELDAEFFRAIELSLLDSFLLPDLHSLIWTIEDEGFFPFCRLFLPSTVVHASLLLQDCPRDLSLLSVLRWSLPQLTNIHIDVPVSTFSTAVISAAVCSWNFVKKLSVVSLDVVALLHIAGLPHLRDLRIKRYISAIGEAAVPTGSFPALRCLSILTDTIQSALALVSRISSPHLQDLSISTLKASAAITWEQFLDVLPRLPSPQSLFSLSLDESCCINAPSTLDCPDKYILTSQNVLPLLQLPNLSTLRICPFFGVQADDAAIHQLADALPRLQTLDLNPGIAPPAGRAPLATPRALFYLVEHCSALRILHLLFNAEDSGAVPLFAREPRTLPPHRLAYLDVGASPIGNPAQVAVFLSSVFADIRAFGAAGGPGDAERKWRDVSRLFRLLRSVRREEAQCWAVDNENDDGISDDNSSDGEGYSEDDDE